MGALSEVEVVESTLIFPTPRQKETTVPLSILDATVTNFTPCGAVWFFDVPGEKIELSEWSLNLQNSLRATLSSFPQFAGALKKVEHVPEGDHTQRYGRLEITFGAATDPGVGFSVAHSPLSLDEVAPTSQRKTQELRSWNLSSPPTTFLPNAGVMKSPIDPRNPAPPMLIQLTGFARRGISLGVMIAHPLADAQAMAVFMHRWSYEHSLLFANAQATNSLPPPGFSPSERPLFNPQLLDTRAAGDIDAASPDERILEKARSLPSSRYDWFHPAADGDPDRSLPPGLTRSMVKSPGTPLPMADWDTKAPVSHRKLHFSAAQIQKFWEAAGPSVSRHDAILAHVWSAVNRARGLSTDDRDVSIHISFGMRRRLGLPPLFMGSPILLTSVTMAGKEASGSPASDIAHKIRSTIALYTEDAVKSRLHDLCYECAPQRFWEAFLGYRHMIFTSWAHLHLYEIDFGGRAKPRYVEPFMPLFDGLICLMEGRSDGNGKHWCDGGVDVSLSLAADAMEMLKVDPELW
ncbi:hypothetical protein BJX99DRAFT_85287 [Aspergillus californicus]